MRARTQLDEARRWAKFPATLLFITSLLWLIVVISRVAQDWDAYVAQPSETFIGALGVLLKIPVVLIGCPLAAIGMLYLQRQALYTGMLLPFIPLVYLSIEKANRISLKFHEYRSQQQIGSFGDAVLEAFILAGLWIVVGLHVDSLRRAIRELNKAEEWRVSPPRDGQRGKKAGSLDGSQPPPVQVEDGSEVSEDDETCFLLPDAVEMRDRDD